MCCHSTHIDVSVDISNNIGDNVDFDHDHDHGKGLQAHRFDSQSWHVQI